MNENNFYCCVICNLQKKNIYICENCYKNKEKCEEDLIHEHPIIFIPKNGVELIRKRDDIRCIGEIKIIIIWEKNAKIAVKVLLIFVGNVLNVNFAYVIYV